MAANHDQHQIPDETEMPKVCEAESPFLSTAPYCVRQSNVSTESARVEANKAKSQEPLPKKSKKPQPQTMANAGNVVSATLCLTQNACQTNSIQRLPFNFEIGPVMRLGDVLAAKPGDPCIPYDDKMAQPTAEELVKHLSERMERETDGKPIFGPERPPQERRQ